MRGELLEILQDRLQGNTFQLHTETVPHTPHKGEQITSFVFRGNHRLVKLFVDLRSIMRICSQAPYGSTVVGQTNNLFGKLEILEDITAKHLKVFMKQK